MKIEQFKKLYPVILILTIYVVYQYRSQRSDTEKQNWQELHKHRKIVQGQTMGTTYSIVYYDSLSIDLKSGIDSLLVRFNNKLSTYIPDSEVSIFNRNHFSDSISPELRKVLVKSQEIFKISKGTFDPTIMPLVHLWGFGAHKSDTIPDTLSVYKTLEYTGLDKLQLSDSLYASDGMTLGFGAIAKGYGVDLVGAFLDSKGIKNYLVEIGGENLLRGVKPGRELWTLKILYPEKERALLQDAYCGIRTTDRAMATSGPYIQQKEINGVKYSHTIDPRTGFPVKQDLLSISVLAKDCMTADAIATALNVMSLEEVKCFLKGHPEFDALVIYSEKGKLKEFCTSGFKNVIVRL